MSPESLFNTGLFYHTEHTGQYVDIEGGRIHYLEKGEGEPLLLLHGLGQSLYTWHKVIDSLARSWRVITPDLPGHGYTEWQGGFSVGEICECISAFLSALGLNWAHLGGFASGGIHALAFAESNPEKCGRIVVVSPGGITSSMPRAVKSFASTLTGWLSAARLSAKTVEKVLIDAYFDRTLVTDQVVEEYFRPLASRQACADLKDAVLAFEDGPTINDLPKISQEVLVMWGTDDRWHDRSMAEEYALLPHVKSFFVRNCGHVVQEEKPERFLEAVEGFLKDGIAQS